MITQTGPGDLFILRNIGTLVPAYGEMLGGVSSAVEYAVLGLGVSTIIVCGHSDCGAMKALLDEKHTEKVKQKESLFLSLLKSETIKAIRSFGLWLAIEFDSFETNKKVIDACIEAGVLTDWFLFASNCLRISPPLVISEEEIKKSCGVINDACGL